MFLLLYQLLKVIVAFLKHSYDFLLSPVWCFRDRVLLFHACKAYWKKNNLCNKNNWRFYLECRQMSVSIWECSDLKLAFSSAITVIYTIKEHYQFSSPIGLFSISFFINATRNAIACIFCYVTSTLVLDKNIGLSNILVLIFCVPRYTSLPMLIWHQTKKRSWGNSN